MRRALLLVLAALTLAGCGGSSDTPPAAGPPSEPTKALADLGSVLDLRAAFNEDEDAPRLILLLSPT